MDTRGSRRAGLGRVLVLLVVASLPLHLFAAVRIREPYPGLFMPGFGGVPIVGDTVSFVNADIEYAFGNGARREVAADDLLPVPLLTAAVLSSSFSQGLTDDGQLDRKEPPGLAYRLAAGYADGRVPGTDVARAHHPRTARWLCDRAAALWPGSNPRRLEVRWRDVQINTETGRRTVSPPFKVVTVDLTGCPPTGPGDGGLR